MLSDLTRYLGNMQLQHTCSLICVFLALLWVVEIGGQGAVLVDYSLYNLSKPEFTYCYTCDAASEYHCYDPDIYLTRQEKCTYGCTTLTTASNGGAVVVRGCGTWMARWSETGCTVLDKGDGSTTTTCYCRSHFCNTQVVDPGSAVTMKSCYFCTYYGRSDVSADVTNDCVTPGGSTPTTPCPYGVCKKSLYYINDYEGLSRSCENNLLNISRRQCVNSDDAGIRTKVCHCETDGCNTASIAKGRSLLAIVSALSIMLVYFQMYTIPEFP